MKKRTMQIMLIGYVWMFVWLREANVVKCQIYWQKLFDSLSYQSNVRPPPRRDAAIGYDYDRNRIVVFGGWQTNTDSTNNFRIPVIFDDTWEFDLNTSICLEILLLIATFFGSN